ncbi:MAG TPA: hypothetical protein VMZ90_07755 [Vicinamibacterales bacterium]|nr:hypothetical protein [Vicinamibacterales bacterium]
MSLAPMVMGMSYAIWPSEARLALMRPLSLAGIFSALTGFCLGLMNSLVNVGNASIPFAENRVWMFGLAESITTLFIGFGCLTVGWLCVALGMRRQAS